MNTITKKQAQAEYERLMNMPAKQRRKIFATFQEWNEAVCKCIDITMTDEDRAFLQMVKASLN